jgi:hypothetical protein
VTVPAYTSVHQAQLTIDHWLLANDYLNGHPHSYGRPLLAIDNWLLAIPSPDIALLIE